MERPIRDRVTTELTIQFPAGEKTETIVSRGMRVIRARGSYTFGQLQSERQLESLLPSQNFQLW